MKRFPKSRNNRRSAGQQRVEELNKPPWTLCIALATLPTLLSCLPAWPGYMSFDSLFAYRQATEGIQTMLWPPMHTYFFEISKFFGAQTWGVFLVQTFLLFFSAFIVMSTVIRNRYILAVLCSIFICFFEYIPSLGGVIQNQWRDIPTASLGLSALACWLIASCYRASWMLVISALCLGIAVALRYNAFVLALGFIPLMIWRPFLLDRASSSVRGLVVVSLTVALSFAWASTQWRLPDFVRLPVPDNIGGTQEFDIIGISACADRSYLPEGMTRGESISPAQIRRAYDPRHLQLSLAPKAGVPALSESVASGELAPIWIYLLRVEPRCYLEHRLEVFKRQMGIDRAGTFYATHGGIDSNSYGLTIAYPVLSQQTVKYFIDNSAKPWRQPYIIYCLTLAMALIASIMRVSFMPLMASILTGCITYPGLLFFAAPAADARYIFPSSVFCALFVCLSIGLIIVKADGPKNIHTRTLEA